MTERPELSPQERMQIERHEVPARSAVIRSMDFREVNLGYSQVLAMEEAERCLDCRNPAASTAARCASTSRASSSCWPEVTSRAPPNPCSTTTRCRV